LEITDDFCENEECRRRVSSKILFGPPLYSTVQSKMAQPGNAST
jgi:hypothetical protein